MTTKEICEFGIGFKIKISGNIYPMPSAPIIPPLTVQLFLDFLLLF